MKFAAVDAKPVKLLIDGDVIAFTAAAAAQNTLIDRFGIAREFAHVAQGEVIVDNMIADLQYKLNARATEVYLSDPGANWRKDIWPEYKANRKALHTPIILGPMKQYLKDAYGATFWDTLEADDTLGILSSQGSETHDLILCGKDKDFKTVPGKYHQLKNLDANGFPVVTEITKWEAMRFHMFQTLKGDMTDGYPGCPGIGTVRAWDLVDNPVLLTNHPRPITRGANKGEMADRWETEPTQDYWAMIVSQYEKAGQTEQEALLTARLANILHHDQYDRATGAITLWTPNRISEAM